MNPISKKKSKSRVCALLLAFFVFSHTFLCEARAVVPLGLVRAPRALGAGLRVRLTTPRRVAK